MPFPEPVPRAEPLAPGSPVAAPPAPGAAGRPYIGHVDGAAGQPHHLVLPAPGSVPLIVKMLDSPHGPPESRWSCQARPHPSTVPAPAYLEVWLARLRAYSLLGLPMDERSGRTVDLVDLVGAETRRLAERIRDAASWNDRFALVDGFVLRQLDEARRRPDPESPGPGSA